MYLVRLLQIEHRVNLMQPRKSIANRLRGDTSEKVHQGAQLTIKLEATYRREELHEASYVFRGHSPRRVNFDFNTARSSVEATVFVR